MKLFYVAIKVLLILLLTVVAIFAALLLYISGGKSLIRQQMTVLVNDVDHVDDAVINRKEGKRFFDITVDHVTAMIYISPYKNDNSSYVINALIKADKSAWSLAVDTIQFRLVHTTAAGQKNDIHLFTEGIPPRIERSKFGQIESWWQEFLAGENLAQFPDGSLELVWSMDYRDDLGEARHLSITVPLRKADIIIPTSLVINNSSFEMEPASEIERRVLRLRKG